MCVCVWWRYVLFAGHTLFFLAKHTTQKERTSKCGDLPGRKSFSKNAQDEQLPGNHVMPERCWLSTKHLVTALLRKSNI